MHIKQRHTTLPAIAIRTSATLALACVLAGRAPITALHAQQGNAPPAQLHPKLVCDQPTHDFGRITDADVIHHTFTLRNEGQAPLEIKILHTTCGCLSASIDHSVVKPGKETYVNAEFRGHNRDGDQFQLINILSNDPNNPRMHLIVRGRVTQAIVLTPERAAFGSVNGADEHTQTVNITFQSDRPVAITGIDVNSTAFSASLAPIPDDPNAVNVVITTNPPLDIGVHRAIVTLKTDDPKNPVITIPITLNAAPPIALLPTTVVLVKSAPPKTQHIAVTSGTQKDFTITSVKKPTSDSHVTVVRLAPGQYRVVLKDITAPPLANGDAYIIKTNSVKAPELTVPVLVINTQKP